MSAGASKVRKQNVSGRCAGLIVETRGGMVCHQEGAQNLRTAVRETFFPRGRGFWIFALPSFQCLPR